MTIFYIVLQILSIINFLQIKKSDKKEKIFFWIPISIILLMSTQIFITFIFSVINIKSTLTNLSLVLILINLIMAIYSYKTKQFQKYYVNRCDIIVNLIIIIFVVIIAYMQYGFPFNISYEVTDASNHYNAAINFYNSSQLLNLNNSNDIYGVYKYDTFMTGHYVNLGILFKSMSTFITGTKGFVNLFIIFELFILYLSGSLMFSLLTRKIHDKRRIIIAFIFTVFYMFGYQLNSEFSGFSYLSLGMCIIISIIMIMEHSYKKKTIKIVNLMILFLLDFSLFFTYYFFVPVVYGTIFVTIIIKFKRKLITLENITVLFYALGLPFICGMYYFYFKEWVKGGSVPGMQAINVPGAIYGKLIINFIMFFVFIIVEIYNCIRKRNKNIFTSILLIFSILFVIILGIGMKNNIVSEYYFYKSYYLLWIATIVVSYKGCALLLSKNTFLRRITYLYILAIIIFIIIATSINCKINLNTIYNENLRILTTSRLDVENEYFEIVDYYKKNLINEKENVYIVPGKFEGRNRWLYQLYNNPYAIFEFFFTATSDFSIEAWINKEIEKDYVIYNKDDFDYEPYENEKYDILINIPAGAILKRK